MKRLLSILLLISLLSSFCGCGYIFYDLYDPYERYGDEDIDNRYEYEDEYEDEYEPYESEDDVDTAEPETTVPETSLPLLETTAEPETTRAPETTKAPETTRAPETTKAPETTRAPETTAAPSYPEFSDLDSLAKYLNKEKNADKFTVTFIWKKNKDEIEAGKLARMTSSSYISWNRRGYVYTVELYEYPGDRIVDAHKSGNTSALSDDEMAAYNAALAMVNDARSRAADDFELELLIHDMVCEKVVYYDDVRSFSDPHDPPRYLTAIGALLDGKANCQGYADAFYTLASIAGFTVDRMSVESSDDLHMLNTILLDGAWYVVDTTYDDFENRPTDHRLFNAGLDVIREFGWKSYNEKHPIAPVSDHNFYYIHYGIVYDGLYEAARAAVDKWASSGTSTVRAMVKGQHDWDSFNGELKAALNDKGVAYKYRYYYRYTSNAAYYIILFE